MVKENTNKETLIRHLKSMLAFIEQNNPITYKLEGWHNPVLVSKEPIEEWREGNRKYQITIINNWDDKSEAFDIDDSPVKTITRGEDPRIEKIRDILDGLD